MSLALTAMVETRCPQCGQRWDTMDIGAAWVHYYNRYGNCNSHEQAIYRKWRVRIAAANDKLGQLS